MLRAVLWDVDGTLAETERDGHRVAFNRAFEAHGLPWRWDVESYGRLLAVAGGFERLLYDLEARRDAPASHDERVDLARRLHAAKNGLYADIVDSGAIPLRNGVRRLIDACAEAGILQGIATTTTRSNVDALLGASFGPDWQRRFAAVVCADDAPCKKPDPQAYRLALARIAAAADEAIALEDSPNGVHAARAAGLPTLLVRSDFFRDAASCGETAWCDDLDSRVTWPGGEAERVDLDALRRIVDRAARA